MAIIESGQIELIDLTDGRPALFSLNTSLSKIQIENNGSYSPDYSSGQVITPVLYIGQDEVEIQEIKYFIGEDEYASKDPEDEIYIDENHRLIIKKNLNDSIIVRAEIERIVFGGATYENLEAQVELTKISSSSGYYAVLKADRNAFTTADTSDITIEACLYNGLTLVNADSYTWYKNNILITGQSEKTLRVTKEDVTSLDVYSCVIELFDSYYSAETTILDYSDKYSAQIISSNGMVFTSSVEETKLICNVYEKNKLIENNISYSWTSSIDRSLILGSSKEIDVAPQSYEMESITYYCEATIGDTKITSQITIIISPTIKIEVSPKEIFLPFKGEEYKGQETYQINLQVTNLSGINIAIDEVAFSGAEDYFYSTVENNIIILSIKDENNLINLNNSILCSVSFKYKGVEFSEEIYLIKTVDGADAAKITNIITEYCYSNDGIRNPDESEEQPIWYENLGSISENGFFTFLWTKTTYTYDDNTTLIEYSVSKNSKEIISIEELYAIGKYVEKIVLQDFDSFVYNEEGKKIAIIKNGEQYEIFDDNGEVLVNVVDGTVTAILDIYGNEVFKSENEDFTSVTFAILYEPELITWSMDIPISALSEVEYADSDNFIEQPVDALTQNYIVLSTAAPQGESLWIKYNFIYKDGFTDESTPIPIEGINGLRLSASSSQQILTNESIQSIVSTKIWGKDETGNDITDFTTYVTQMPTSILQQVVTNEEFKTYFNLTQEGVTIGKTASRYTTFTDDKGFSIRYYPNTYDPLKTEGQEFQTVGSFDNKGLTTSQISLKDNLNNPTITQASIILKATNSGGWVWIKKTNG